MEKFKFFNFDAKKKFPKNRFFYIGKSKKNQNQIVRFQNTPDYTLRQTTACQLQAKKKIKNIAYSLFSVRPSKEKRLATFFPQRQKGSDGGKTRTCDLRGRTLSLYRLSHAVI
jgi:hypothetical protein